MYEVLEDNGQWRRNPARTSAAGAPWSDLAPHDLQWLLDAYGDKLDDRRAQAVAAKLAGKTFRQIATDLEVSTARAHQLAFEGARRLQKAAASSASDPPDILREYARAVVAPELAAAREVMERVSYELSRLAREAGAVQRETATLIGTVRRILAAMETKD